jgi:hypothetical protein
MTQLYQWHTPFAVALLGKLRNGTTVNGKRLPRDKEKALPDRAEIALGGSLKLTFEGRR